MLVSLSGLHIPSIIGLWSCINLVPFIMCIHALSVHLHFRKQTLTCCVEMLSCSGSNIQGHFPFILKLFRAEAAFPAPLRGLQWATTPNPPGILGTFSLWFQVTTYTHTLSTDHRHTHNTLHSSLLYFCCLYRVGFVSFPSLLLCLSFNTHTYQLGWTTTWTNA